MSAHDLLNNLLNDLRKSDQMRGLSSFLLLFATNLINSIIVKLKLPANIEDLT